MTLHGIDVSHWQSGLQLAKTDAQFALFKATDGTSYVDATCDGFVNQAKKLGIPWGVYHFWQGNPTAEADHFVDSVAGYIGHGLLVLDFEGAHAVSASAAKTFLDRVYSRTGVRPLIYMSQSVTRQFDWSAVAKNYALWVARYGSSSYGDTGAWKTPVMWQYTDAHKTGGYSVDGDYFYGDKATWTAFATGDQSHTSSSDDEEDDMPSAEEIAKAVWNHQLDVPSALQKELGKTARAADLLRRAANAEAHIWGHEQGATSVGEGADKVAIPAETTGERLAATRRQTTQLWDRLGQLLP